MKGEEKVVYKVFQRGSGLANYPRKGMYVVQNKVENIYWDPLCPEESVWRGLDCGWVPTFGTEILAIWVKLRCRGHTQSLVWICICGLSFHFHTQSPHIVRIITLFFINSSSFLPFSVFFALLDDPCFVDVDRRRECKRKILHYLQI